ncbi:MAG TPA: Hsp70 family protein, partial [Myxococcaceae bacterium]|nr:Hsp70 family protein [Myxococcaceae bacterium]
GAPTLTAPPFEAPTEEPKRAGPIIGIDLGTTNSCASFVQAGKAAVLKSREGYNTVPSILALNPRGKLVVGHPAKNQMLTNPRLTVYGAKRLVGRPYESQIVQQIKDRFHYEIAPGDSGEAAVKLADRVYTLQQISALILREVREGAQNQLGQPVSRAVITVPAYYNDNQRQAVREAAKLAGLHVERILNEPTAAALAYGYGRNLKQRILVYDLGGGTFDASVLELSENIYEVISTGGDTFLGGIDFDNAIVEHLLKEFVAKTGKPFEGDRVAMQRVTDAAERAKCALSERSEVRVHVPFVTMVEGQPYDLDVTLTRDKLVSLTERLVDRTLEVCDEVLKAKGLTPKDVDEIILVGGQSRFPLVHEKISKFFGKTPSKGAHPDEAVATGAALLAHSLGQLEGVVLIDVLPMAIGIGLPGGRFKAVLDRNSPLPSTKKYSISTARENQTEVEVNVFQGDSDKTLENEFLGTLKLTGLPKGPRGSVSVEVSFEVNNECILRVAAKEVATGREVSSTFSTKKDATAMKTGRTGEYAAAGGAPPPAAGQPAPAATAAPAAANVPPGTPAPEIAAAANKSGGFIGWVKRLFGRG